ncbi:MAG: flagellar protein FlaG [Lachnospiraceae bacterium]|nr:flagellar protein FlaG [Lachnospiraceae bacterium]
MDALNTSYNYSVSGQGSSAGAQPKAAPEPIPEETAAQSVDAIREAVTKPQTDSKTSDDTQAEQKSASDKQIEDAVKSINKHANGTEAIFGIHDKTNRVTIKIVDKKTHEVIKEVPPEKTLDLIAKAWEMAGLIVDDKR